MEEAKAEAMKAMTSDIIYDQLREKLLIESIRATGRVTSDDFGLMLLVDNIETYTPEVAADARALLDEIEGEGVE